LNIHTKWPDFAVFVSLIRLKDFLFIYLCSRTVHFLFRVIIQEQRPTIYEYLLPFLVVHEPEFLVLCSKQEDFEHCYLIAR